MPGRLAASVSPYLRSHADNPVDWWRWGEEPFAEAVRRDVPVLVSIGYATCHWCHVMARESFSDPELAGYLNERFVAIKVDREEHPDVDATFIAAASAFTRHLGWPLTVFTTPDGNPVFGGTYFPPIATGGMPAFRDVLQAVSDAWANRRDDLEATGRILVEALAARAEPREGGLPVEPELAAAAVALEVLEDPEFGGFGSDAKFPTAPAVAFLFERDAAGDEQARRIRPAHVRDDGAVSAARRRRGRVLPLRRAPRLVRAALRADAERQRPVARPRRRGGRRGGRGRARGLPHRGARLPSGAFASAQDSESLLDGERSEGGYYALDATERARQPRPKLDAKVLTGLNGLAIGALATAGVRFGRSDWVDSARQAADAVLALQPGPDRLVRASLDGEISDAVATLEDFGGLAGGLLRLALASGEPHYAVVARGLVQACRTVDGTIAAPGGGDPVLSARGMSVDGDASEGASPSGRALVADAALRLDALGGGEGMREVAASALGPLLTPALANPIGFGATMAVAQRLASQLEQLVVVTSGSGTGGSGTAADDAGVTDAARAWVRPSRTVALVTEAQASAFADAGFELFAARTTRDDSATAYFCEHFVCALPVTTGAELDSLLAERGPK